MSASQDKRPEGIAAESHSRTIGRGFAISDSHDTVSSTHVGYETRWTVMAVRLSIGLSQS